MYINIYIIYIYIIYIIDIIYIYIYINDIKFTKRNAPNNKF